jgi:hypothetical protein
MIGILPQLADCGRWTDVAGGDFPINTFLETDIWNIVRARRSQNRPASEIDIYTDETTADEFMTAYIAYSKAKTGDIVRINVESGFTEWGFPFRRLKLYKPSGVFVNLITADFFNDLATAASYNAYGYGSAPFGVGAGGLGRFLMVLDMGQGGTIYPAILNSNRKQYTVGEINDLARVDRTFSTVMENPTYQAHPDEHDHDHDRGVPGQQPHRRQLRPDRLGRLSPFGLTGRPREGDSRGRPHDHALLRHPDPDDLPLLQERQNGSLAAGRGTGDGCRPAARDGRSRMPGPEHRPGNGRGNPRGLGRRVRGVAKKNVGSAAVPNSGTRVHQPRGGDAHVGSSRHVGRPVSFAHSDPGCHC